MYYGGRYDEGSNGHSPGLGPGLATSIVAHRTNRTTRNFLGDAARGLKRKSFGSAANFSPFFKNSSRRVFRVLRIKWPKKFWEKMFSGIFKNLFAEGNIPHYLEQGQAAATLDVRLGRWHYVTLLNVTSCHVRWRERYGRRADGRTSFGWRVCDGNRRQRCDRVSILCTFEQMGKWGNRERRKREPEGTRVTRPRNVKKKKM